ncbi:hypothetical protein ACQE3E_15600 [Methylomonas sp. MED-D]|uniref:hypothetical protein n=1 Tax=unclassified Methylomonas TaxID=2608980 RepID=UPI003D0177B5
MRSSLLAVLFAAALFFLQWGLRARLRGNYPGRLALLMSTSDGHTCYVLDTQPMKKLSTAIAYFIVSLVGLTVEGVQASVDGVFTLESTDPGVLSVTPLPNGQFRVDVVGVGSASLVAGADADLSDSVKRIEQGFEFLIYNETEQADHIDLTILEFYPRETVAADAAASAESAVDAVEESAASTGEETTV